MAMTEYSIDLKLPVVPEVRDPELFNECMKIYNALRALAIGVDDYTESGDGVIEAELTAIAAVSEVAQLRSEVRELKEQLAAMQELVNWGQPGKLGDVTPNEVLASSFALAPGPVSGTIALPAAAVDPATTMALANAIRAALITFKLGV